jgi:hypothetical protein
VRDSEILDLINQLYVLCGIRKEYFLDASQVLVFIKFIKFNFPNLRINEVKLAFNWCLSGKIEGDFKNFQQINAEYFSKVIRSYMKYIAIKKLALVEEPKKEPTEEEKKAIIRNSIKETLIKEYKLSLETGVNHVKDKFGVYFTTLENIGLLEVSKEQKIKMFENRRDEILKMKATSQEDWRDLDDFRKNKGGKANKYYTQCMQDCRAKCTEEYILGCLEIGFDLESEILKRL